MNMDNITSNIQTVASTFLQHENELNLRLRDLNFGSCSDISYIYRPLEYASEPHASFVRKYCTGEKPILILGMNPGAWGMCQTGVPLGEIKAVSEWMEIRGSVLKPEDECPKRPIDGFDVVRSERSGKRFFDLFREISGVPENFFRNSFLYNFCPLQMMDSNGRNITPNDLRGTLRKTLEEYCGETLLQILQLLNTKIIIALGKYAQRQVQKVFKKNNIIDIRVVDMPHPSPLVQDWPNKARKVLNGSDLMGYFIN